MGKKLKLILLKILFILILPVNISAQNPDISVNGYILMEAETGQVLAAHNADTKLNPASTTKIMTAILALENLSLDEEITASQNVLGIIGTRLYISPGETLTVEQLLYGLMVHSANDAALVLAEGIAGSQEDFAYMMNKRARELGAVNTNFVNPHGLTDEGHLTTARDLAIISQYAMTIPKFRELVATNSYSLPMSHANDGEMRIVNTNALLRTYDNAHGIKTGYTSAARHTIVASAKKDNMELIAVVLGSPTRNALWQDATKLLDYGFDNYEKITLLSESDIIDNIKVKYGDSVPLVVKEGFKFIVPKGKENMLVTDIKINQSIKAPISKGTSLGYIEFYYGKDPIGRIDLLAKSSVNRKFYTYYEIQVLAALLITFTMYKIIMVRRKKNKYSKYNYQYASLQRWK